jgi:hypothetical protein
MAPPGNDGIYSGPKNDSPFGGILDPRFLISEIDQK